MIEIFSRDGSSTVVDAPLAAVCDIDGDPAVFLLRDDLGVVTVLFPADEKFTTLCRALGKKPSKISSE